MKIADKKLILGYLKKQKLMTLATYSDKPWVATVYYVTDEDLNLYFLTSPETEHGQAIVKNKNVACNIADSHQKVIDKKVGLQIQGIASQVRMIKSIKWILKMWHKVNPGKEEILNLKNMKNKVVKARVYKVTPERFKFFNEKLYPREEFKIFYP
jgi:uncharacterized protein YhbP (UPF0306 family)